MQNIHRTSKILFKDIGILIIVCIFLSVFLVSWSMDFITWSLTQQNNNVSREIG